MNAHTRIWRRVLNVFAPGVMSVPNDTGNVLTSQVTIGYLEVAEAVPILQHFGFSSLPPPGSDVALLYVGGDRSNGLGIATGHSPTRPGQKLSGETVIYNAMGMAIYLSANGIQINGGGQPVTITGDLHVTGAVIQGFGGAAAVSLGTHQHGKGTAAAGTTAPTPGT